MLFLIVQALSVLCTSRVMQIKTMQKTQGPNSNMSTHSIYNIHLCSYSYTQQDNFLPNVYPKWIYFITSNHNVKRPPKEEIILLAEITLINQSLH